MNTLEQLKVALGEPLKKTLGGQEFEFYPLDITSMPDFFELSSRTTGKDESAVVKLMMAMLKKSFPKDTSEELLGEFAMKYFIELQEILVELNSPDVDKLSPKQKNRIEELRARNLAAKNANTNLGTNQPASQP